MSLADMLAKHGRRDEARSMLAEIYALVHRRVSIQRITRMLLVLLAAHRSTAPLASAGRTRRPFLPEVCSTCPGDCGWNVPVAAARAELPADNPRVVGCRMPRQLGQPVFPGADMPLYIDVHNFQGTTTVQVDQAHAADLEEQGKYGVEYLKYWFNESHGKAFCLVDAPSPEAAQLVHREAHGQIAERIIEVQPEVVEAFLGGGETSPSGAVLRPGGAGNERDPAIRTILFTDMVGSTNEALGDDAGLALLGVHDTIVRDALAAADGREVKHTGDGIMASFVSAAAAVRCATGILRALAKHQEEHTEYPLQVRIGVASGEPVEREHDLFGATVQLAARLCSHAQPEQILVSNVVAELCLGKGLPFKDLGDVFLKGFSRPIRVHVVEWSGAT
jgi:class 3 adenylate cyclase